MGKKFDALNDNLTRFVLRQPMFFVATAPSGRDGHVNVSPKGLAGSLTVIDPSTVAYVDLTGSGIETIAHIRDNGRITLMFNAYVGPPMILRLFGRGEVVMADQPDFGELRARFPTDLPPTVRAVILIHLYEVRTSCGYGVPLMDHRADRDDLHRWADRKGADGLVANWEEKNLESLDSLPGLPYVPPAPA
jgi:hypothetical protein